MEEAHGTEVYNLDWIRYFFGAADYVSKKSACLSRKVGAILVKDKVIIATGYAGPPRGFPHCVVCRRRSLPDYVPGKNLEICPSVHAEANCLAAAARVGAPIKGSTLFLNTNVPCKSCFGQLVNAGIVQVFALDGWYDELSVEMSHLLRLNVYQRKELLL